jgi:hypothetical protein
MLLAGESDAEFLKRIEDAPVTVDQWQIEKLALVTSRYHVSWYVPGVPAEYQDKLWGRCYPTSQAALGALAEELAPASTVAVIPEGPYVLAKAGRINAV